MARVRRGTTGGDGVGRNRATPAKLFKLYKYMSRNQKRLVKDVGFGGLLKIKSGRLPVTFSKWLVKIFDPELEAIVIPGRGRIKANAAAVHRVTGLPMGADVVKYEHNGVANHFINDVCKFQDCTAPRLSAIFDWLKASKEANDDYLRHWLMLAISTFLCGSTSLTISPKCYPALVDLAKVKDLNWCQFVVDTLKTSVGKIDKQDSIIGCQFFLTILYLDSLELKDIQVPDTLPRVAAWDTQLLNKVIKMDSNPNGTYGKLKLKEIDGVVSEFSLLGDLRDIENFISHRASVAMSAKKKRRYAQVLMKASTGITEVMGTMISELSAISDDSDGQEDAGLRRSSRRRTNNRQQQAEVSIDDDDENDDDYNVHAEEEEEEEQLEEDAEEEEQLEEDAEEEEQLEEDVEEEEQLEGDADVVVEYMDAEEVDLEDSGVELEDEGVEVEDVRVDPPNKVDIPVFSEKGEALVAATVKNKEDVGNMENTSMENTAPLEVIPSQETRSERSHSYGQSKMDMLNGDKVAIPVASIPSQKSRKEKLRLPPSTSAAGKSPWDFSVPPIDIMSFVELPPHLESPPPTEKLCSPERNGTYDDGFWENLTASDLKRIGDVEKKARAQKAVLIEDAEMSVRKVPSCSAAKKAGVHVDTPFEDVQRILTREGKAAGSSSCSAKSAPSSSHTPAYQPAPRRPACPERALRSPYIDCYRKGFWKCTKIEARVYDAVCSASRRTTRSSSQSPSPDDHIISYPNYYASLKHLSESVKLGGELVNTIAEIGIYALKDKSQNPDKQILPLRIASYIQEGVLDNREIKSAFDRSTHHLDRSQLVMFPVLQKISVKRLDRTAGHYFLLVLNLREGRFEVLDSMRSIADTRLMACCEDLMRAIKAIWRVHYPRSRKNIDGYQLLDIKVPQQTNNHDCGFHMLMHCEHWNGIILPQFKQKDMSIIRKLVTYKWLNHPENSVAWKCILGI